MYRINKIYLVPQIANKNYVVYNIKATYLANDAAKTKFLYLSEED